MTCGPFDELRRYSASPAELISEHLAVRARHLLTGGVSPKGWQDMRVETKRVKLTDRFVKSATTGGRKSPIFTDDEVIGFGIQVRETGRRSFILDYMFEGRRRQLYIGDFPDCSTNAVPNRRNTREDWWHLLRRHNDAIGPERHLPRCSDTDAIGG
jgi:hypothetical protein